MFVWNCGNCGQDVEHDDFEHNRRCYESFLLTSFAMNHSAYSMAEIRQMRDQELFPLNA